MSGWKNHNPEFQRAFTKQQESLYRETTDELREAVLSGIRRLVLLVNDDDKLIAIKAIELVLKNVPTNFRPLRPDSMAFDFEFRT